MIIAIILVALVAAVFWGAYQCIRHGRIDKYIVEVKDKGYAGRQRVFEVTYAFKNGNKTYVEKIQPNNYRFKRLISKID